MGSQCGQFMRAVSRFISEETPELVEGHGATVIDAELNDIFPRSQRLLLTTFPYKSSCFPRMSNRELTDRYRSKKS